MGQDAQVPKQKEKRTYLSACDFREQYIDLYVL